MEGYLAIAKYDSNCKFCRGKIHKGDTIKRYFGDWCHPQCIVEEAKRNSIASKATEWHRESLGIDEITYSVTCSIGQAMKYALENDLITKGDYDFVKQSATYRIIWNHVAD